VQWLIASVVASVVLTVALNLALRSFPDTNDRLARRLADLGTPKRPDEQRVRIVFPWKAMLLASLILTVCINAWLWLN